ncbi:MAG: hypothetical protein JO199_13525 [Candidatus Eremiobacteraeota bacterium]|nr:hypothetical protein [Candidatus Eremiobacteraeota bacterium]
MRSLASFFDENRPEIAAVHAIDSGDALSLATRFALGWAYGDGLALFWKPRFSATRAEDVRRALHVDGLLDGRPTRLAGVALSRDRTRIRELRAVRSDLREVRTSVLLFASGLRGRTRFRDIGFEELDVLAPYGGCIAARGFALGQPDESSGNPFASAVVRAVARTVQRG